MSANLVMTITIHSPKCKYCHLILLLEKILRGMHFSLVDHLLLVSLIEEREREGSTKEGREGREGKGRKERGKEGRREHSFLLPFGLSLTQLKSEMVSDS